MRQQKIITTGARSGIISERIVEAPQSGKRKNPPPAGPGSTPTTAQMAANFAAAMRQFAASGFKSSKHEQERIDICTACERMGKTGIWKGRCTACGCFVKAKARIAAQECPLGKWPEE